MYRHVYDTHMHTHIKHLPSHYLLYVGTVLNALPVSTNVILTIS